MGYKLAGYDVLGGVEIDKDMMAIYRKNHAPKHSFMMSIQDFNQSTDFDQALMNVDILDGSPPCSSFSTAGQREKKWGKQTYFREGQARQVLDDLFFHFIDTADLLKPKVVIAENVLGLIKGKARGYVKEIIKGFEAIGYRVQLFKLCSSRMGVPQRRERVFFICARQDIGLSTLRLRFNEPEIPFKAIGEGIDAKGLYKWPHNKTESKVNWSKATPYKIKYELWSKTKPGHNFGSVHPRGHRWSQHKVDLYRPLPTIVSRDAMAGGYLHPKYPRTLSRGEMITGQSFPLDFDFRKEDVGYVLGMSVPPFMMQRIALEIYSQWGAQLGRS